MEFALTACQDGIFGKGRVGTRAADTIDGTASTGSSPRSRVPVGPGLDRPGELNTPTISRPEVAGKKSETSGRSEVKLFQKAIFEVVSTEYAILAGDPNYTKRRTSAPRFGVS